MIASTALRDPPSQWVGYERLGCPTQAERGRNPEIGKRAHLRGQVYRPLGKRSFSAAESDRTR